MCTNTDIISVWNHFFWPDEEILVNFKLTTDCSCFLRAVHKISSFISALSWVTVIFAMIGKMFVSCGFTMAYTYTGEIFPTVCRTFIMGSCSFFARIGSLCSPYLYQIVSTAIVLFIFKVNNKQQETHNFHSITFWGNAKLVQFCNNCPIIPKFVVFQQNTQ